MGNDGGDACSRGGLVGRISDYKQLEVWQVGI